MKVIGRSARPSFVRPRIAALTIQRRGNSMWVVSGEHHCGPNSHLVPFRRDTGETVQLMPVDWVLTCRCAPVTDSRGFLFDQANVAAFMDRLAGRGTDMSCEQLAQHVSLLFMDKLARDAAHCQILKLTVQLSPAPHVAWVEAEYTRE